MDPNTLPNPQQAGSAPSVNPAGSLPTSGSVATTTPEVAANANRIVQPPNVGLPSAPASSQPTQAPAPLPEPPPRPAPIQQAPPQAQPQPQPIAYQPPPPQPGFRRPQAPAPMQTFTGPGAQAAYGGQPPQPPVGVQPKTNPNSTQNTLQIAEIRDGIVIMNDGSFRSVVMVKSVNFDLMSPQEQEGVEYAYQGFLNSLYFPVQVFVRSQKVDIRPYIEKLDKIRTEHDNMLLSLLMEDYIGFMEQLAQQTNIMDKKFYVVVPYYQSLDSGNAVQASKSFFERIMGDFSHKKAQHVVINESDLEKGKTELRNRVQSVLSGLLQCGVQGIPLDTQELIELYYDTYNPGTASRQLMHDFGQLNAPVITKGEGTAPQPQLDRELQ